jgi:hypothetical protein
VLTAGERTRAEARRAAAGLGIRGGTAIGQWLRLAFQIFQSCPAALRHAILLTDGQNVHETPEELAAAIELCEGVFRCDCRGIGTDWDEMALDTRSVKTVRVRMDAGETAGTVRDDGL